MMATAVTTRHHEGDEHLDPGPHADHGQRPLTITDHDNDHGKHDTDKVVLPPGQLAVPSGTRQEGSIPSTTTADRALRKIEIFSVGGLQLSRL